MSKENTTSMQGAFFAELVRITTEIVANYIAYNKVSFKDIPHIVNTIYQTLGTCCNAPVNLPKPAVPIHKSIFNDYIVCLEDGKKLKTLKRHLMTVHNMTLDQYREKWDLKADYHMVAPNYAGKRSAIAKRIGLGFSRKRKRIAA